MWKKPENEAVGAAVLGESISPSGSKTAKERTMSASERALIGTSLTVKGDLSGEEDLLIEGQVEGNITLKQNTVTIGKNGRVTANVYAKIINVEGEMIGDLFGGEQVIVHRSGRVRGNITAPRVTLEDGAKLKGTIDMDPRSTEQQLENSTLRRKVSEKEHVVVVQPS